MKKTEETGFDQTGYSTPCNNADHKGMFRALKWEIINAGLSSSILSYVEILERNYRTKEIAKKDEEIKVLRKKLELIKPERLCPDHRAKGIGNKTGCVACDAEYYERKRSLEGSGDKCGKQSNNS